MVAALIYKVMILAKDGIQLDFCLGEGWAIKGDTTGVSYE